MPINVTLGTNDLEISDANGDLIDTIAYQSIDTIAYVNNPGTVVNSSTLGAAPTVTGDPQWSAVIWLRDGRKAVIMLGDVDNQAGWTNDQTGFDALVADIYAAFPVGGGGGGAGTVTSINVSGGTTGYSFTGGPVTASGTITMTGSAAIPTGNTLWVDRVYGDDPTALPNRQDLPYDTVMGALAAASSGDLIHVRAGTSSEVIDDSDAPAIVHLYFEPGATAESIAVSTSGGWTITGGTLDEDITFSLNTGETLVLQTVTMRNLNSTDFNAIIARECYLTGNTTATNGGSIIFRNCIIDANTTADGGGITSYNTAHLAGATVQNGGVLQGYDSSISGTVTADPVTGDFWDGVMGSDGDTQVLGADGRWAWSNALAGKADAVPTWRGAISQSGTDAPVATVASNTLGGSIVWTYGAVGSYVGTLAGAFPLGTVVILSVGAGGAWGLADKPMAFAYRANDNVIGIDTGLDGVFADDVLANSSLLIIQG